MAGGLGIDAWRSPSCHRGFGEVFQVGDVENRTAGERLSEAVRVEIDPDVDNIFPHQRHVMVDDVAVAPVGKTEAKRTKGAGVHEVTNVLGRDRGASFKTSRGEVNDSARSLASSRG